MICNKCGVYNGEEAVFCAICGTKLEGDQGLQAPESEPFNPVEKAIKSVAASKVFLVSVILYSLQVLISFSQWHINSVSARISALLGRYGIFQIMGNAIVNLGFFFANALPIFILLGLWLTYSAGKKPYGMKTTGLSIIKTVINIQFIVECIAVAIFLVATLIAMGASVIYGRIEYLVMIFILLPVVVAVIILNIIYRIKIIGSLKGVIKGIKSGKTPKKISVIVPVICIIIAIINIMSAFTGVFSELTYGVYYFNAAQLLLLGLNTLLSGATYGVFAIVIFKVRNELKKIEKIVE